MDNKVELFQSDDNQIEIQVSYNQESVWLNRQQMSVLFERDIKTIGKHINNVFAEGELEENRTVAKFATVQNEGGRFVERQLEYYNLDVTISVGYRVKSLRGTQFRIWATKVLKEKLLENVTQKNSAAELANVVKYIARITEGKALDNPETTGLLHVITDYSRALELLDKYDHQQLELNTVAEKSAMLSVEEVRQLVAEMNEQYGSGNLFGKEKDRSLESSVSSIFQTFEGRELYPTPEIKAANLLYFLTKNHSFVDGNKRIAAATFIYFLNKNNLLYREFGMKRIDNNTLVALTLLLAESNPDDREMLVKVIVNLL